MNTGWYCSSPGPAQIRLQKGSVPLAVHPEFMPFFISRPTCEFPLGQGIKNTSKPQRKGHVWGRHGSFSSFPKSTSESGLQKTPHQGRQLTLGEITGNGLTIPSHTLSAPTQSLTNNEPSLG